MNVRAYCVIAAATVALEVSAQTLAAPIPEVDPNLMVLPAYSSIQSGGSFTLSLAGVESEISVGHVSTRTFFANLYVSVPPGETTATAELDDYDTSGKAPVLVHRYVADGQTLWSYDLMHGKYSATFYGHLTQNGKPPAWYPGSDAPRLLSQLFAATRGPAAYLVRLAREINPGIPGGSTFTSWSPGTTPGEPPVPPPVVAPTPDPLVSSRSYSTSAGQEWLLYGPQVYNPANGQPMNTANPDRSVAFEFDSINNVFELTKIYFAEVRPTKSTEWTMSIESPTSTIPPISTLDPTAPASSPFQPYSQSVTQNWRSLGSANPYSG